MNLPISLRPVSSRMQQESGTQMSLPMVTLLAGEVVAGIMLPGTQRMANAQNFCAGMGYAIPRCFMCHRHTPTMMATIGILSCSCTYPNVLVRR